MFKAMNYRDCVAVSRERETLISFVERVLTITDNDVAIFEGEKMIAYLINGELLSTRG